jgi:hypothetical protein
VGEVNKLDVEKAEKDALLQRIGDIYAGAWGREITDEDFCTAADLALIIPALKARFGAPYDYVWSFHNIGNFNDPEAATEFLYRAGVRA